MGRHFGRLRSLAVGMVVYATVLAGGFAATLASAGPSEPNPPWADDKLPAASGDALFLLGAFAACQVVAFAGGTAVALWCAADAEPVAAADGGGRKV